MQLIHKEATVLTPSFLRQDTAKCPDCNVEDPANCLLTCTGDSRLCILVREMARVLVLLKALLLLCQLV